MPPRHARRLPSREARRRSSRRDVPDCSRRRPRPAASMVARLPAASAATRICTARRSVAGDGARAAHLGDHARVGRSRQRDPPVRQGRPQQPPASDAINAIAKDLECGEGRRPGSSAASDPFAFGGGLGGDPSSLSQVSSDGRSDTATRRSTSRCARVCSSQQGVDTPAAVTQQRTSAAAKHSAIWMAWAAVSSFSAMSRACRTRRSGVARVSATIALMAA